MEGALLGVESAGTLATVWGRLRKSASNGFIFP